MEDGVLRYVAGPGEFNQVSIDPEQPADGVVVLTEYAASVDAGSGCIPFGGFSTFACVGVESIEVDADDADDDIHASDVRLPLTARGGEGDDAVVATNRDDVIDGGPGDDHLTGWTGSDTLTGGEGNDRVDGEMAGIQGEDPGVAVGSPDFVDGGPGDDTLLGGPDADTLHGGPGVDLADYSWRETGVVITLDGQPNDGAPGENDALGGDIEHVRTGDGNDVVAGSAEPNTIDTSEGDDTIRPLGGADTVRAGPGADDIDIRDGGVDALRCEGGIDTVRGDHADGIDADCEAVERVADSSSAQPSRLVLKLRRITGRTVTVRGRVVVGDAKVCAGLPVRVELRSGRRRAELGVALDEVCGFSATVPLRVRRGARARARATFAGSTALQPAASRWVERRRPA